MVSLFSMPTPRDTQCIDVSKLSTHDFEVFKIDPLLHGQDNWYSRTSIESLLALLVDMPKGACVEELRPLMQKMYDIALERQIVSTTFSSRSSSSILWRLKGTVSCFRRRGACALRPTDPSSPHCLVIHYHELSALELHPLPDPLRVRPNTIR